MLTASVVLTIDSIQQEVRQMVESGIVQRQQPIYALSQQFPEREWKVIKEELELHGYLLRDWVIDLMGREDWNND